MDNLRRSNVLVVGAGGIGCELLKNLVMWNFTRITVVDLDTIDVSNLNRQFLFRKEHVGKSKALTAKESVLVFNPNVTIEAIHDDIMRDKYNVDFFKSFNVVLNALDNRTARNFVNRMCLKANVPLIESGTTGYRGQVQVIIKGKTACYECLPKPVQKQYPACTIRNTPSEPIHCIVWAKFLFNQLFGEPDADEDVVPDQNDPELEGVTENGDKVDNVKVNIRVAWLSSDDEGQYNPALLLKILFCDNINSLLSMKCLWMKDNRVKPVTLEQSCLDADISGADQYISSVTGGVKDQENLSLLAWCQVFKKSSLELGNRLKINNEPLHWDKDDVTAMDFVAAAANIRMSLFHILPMKLRFDIKSMAGNIIPAIATTNALIAGITCLQAYKILNGQADSCLDVMVSDFVSSRGKVVQAVSPLPPVSDCYVCSSRQEVTLVCRSAESVTLSVLKSQVLEHSLHMLAPNVSILNRVLIDGGEEEDDAEVQQYLSGSTLASFEGVSSGTVLRCSDFLQQYEFNLELRFSEEVQAACGYELQGDIEGVRLSAKKDSGAEEEQESSVSRKRRLEEEEGDRGEIAGERQSKVSKVTAAPLGDGGDCEMVALVTVEEEEEDDLMFLD